MQESVRRVTTPIMPEPETPGAMGAILKGVECQPEGVYTLTLCNAPSSVLDRMRPGDHVEVRKIGEPSRVVDPRPPQGKPQEAGKPADTAEVRALVEAMTPMVACWPRDDNNPKLCRARDVLRKHGVAL